MPPNKKSSDTLQLQDCDFALLRGLFECRVMTASHIATLYFDSKLGIHQDPDDATVERRFRRIPEFGGRVLRVAVNTTVEPNRVVSVFFDRKMKGKL